MRGEAFFVGKPVESLQAMLRQIAAVEASVDSVIPNGRFGQDTARAVASFQRFAHLPQTGKVDLQTHIMFICDVTECVRLSDKETMTYTYYQKNVKPKPDTGKKGFVCKVCGYVYEGDELPADFICPLCKHGAADFEPIQ